MNREQFTDKIVVTIGLILIFGSVSVNYVEDYGYMSNYLFRFGGIFIVVAAFRSILKRDVFLHSTFKLFTYLYGIFISFIILSMIVNQSLEVEVYSLERFILVFLFLGVSLSLIDVVSEKIIINSVIISLGILFIHSLIEYPISNAGRAYSGIFGNPNVFGLVAATFTATSLVASASLFKTGRKYVLATLYLLIFIVGSYFVVISNSRTSFITLIILIGIVSITCMYDVLKSRDRLSWKSVSIVVLLAIGGMSLFILIDNPIYSTIDSHIIDKFMRKAEINGVTDGRSALWVSIIKEANYFGHVHYFSDIRLIHAHNSFLHIVITYGWFAGIAYTIFWIAMFIKSIHHYVTQKSVNTYALLPLIVILNFLLLSMTELIEFHVGTFIAISMIAILSKPKETLFKSKI